MIGCALLVVIVEQDHEIQALEALEKLEIRAFTRLTGGGSGVWQAVSRPVDPEKAVLLSVIATHKIESALRSLNDEGGLGEPGRGIAFVTPVIAGIGAGLPT